jgi:nitrous oxidase accessory protein NosD
LTIEAQATIRYVSKTGTSTPPYTSWQTAADSIQKCINICVDGDTIYVANGVYKENLVINTAISLIGSSMDSTVIDGRGLADFTIDFNSSGDIENFNIFGKGYGVPNAYGIWALVLNALVSIKNCQINETAVGCAYSCSLIAENVFINKSKVGISLGSSGLTNIYIQNTFINVEGANSKGISIGFASESIFDLRNNIILYSGTDNPGSGISIGAVKKIYIYNNLISGFRPNIYFDTIVDTSNVENNLSVYSDDDLGSIYLRNTMMKVKNNVFKNNRTGLRIFGDPDDAYNLYWENLLNINNGSLNDSDIVADPMFMKDTIPTANANYDFHLQKYSPAIDKGNPDILDLDGSRSDIGLYGGPFGETYTYQDLAPKPPGNLTASMDSGLVHLKWNKNTEADLFRYRVYRDTVPDFVYDTTKIIAVLSDTLFYNDPPQKFISGNYYYKITALDNTYHQSAASEEVHINITGIPEAPPIVVEHYRLLNNYPNPFNPSTTIPYRLKAPGYVKVMVYNILGEMVKVLVNKYQNAGYYEVLFSPDEMEKKRGEEGFPGMHTWYHSNYVSGVYLLRIEVIGEGNIPVFTDMKKMMLVK